MEEPPYRTALAFELSPVLIAHTFTLLKVPRQRRNFSLTRQSVSNRFNNRCHHGFSINLSVSAFRKMAGAEWQVGSTAPPVSCQFSALPPGFAFLDAKRQRKRTN